MAGRLTGLVTATQTEHRIEADVWDDFFSVVLAAPRNRVEHEIRAWAWTRKPSGTRANYSLPLVRVTTRKSFVAGLQAQASASVVLPAVVASKIADQILDPVDWAIARTQLALMGLNLSSYVMWATFDRSKRPFGDLLGMKADEIACDLGLDDSTSDIESFQRQGALLMMEYEPGSESVHIPTMVEAWASNPPNYYFSPSTPGLRYGETRPWRTPPAGHSPRRRPEVVHAPSPAAGLRSHALEVAP